MHSFEVLKPTLSGCCVVCGTKTCVVCHRCGDFYCSKKCQLNDWQRHRYICFSIPALVHPLECSAFGIMEVPSQPAIQQVCDNVNVVTVGKIDEEKAELSKKEVAALTPTAGSVSEYDKTYKADESVNATGSSSSSTSNNININNNDNSNTNTNNNSSNNNGSNNALKKMNTKISGPPPFVSMPLSGNTIYITGFRSVNRCFVRDASENAEKAYLEVCQKVHSLGKDMNKLYKPKIYSYALAKYKDQFRRVKIIPGPCVRLQYLDLGFVKPRGCVEIREISHEIMQLPCSVIEFQLKGVPNAPMSNEVINFFSNFENKRFILQYGSNRLIELEHVDTRQSLNLQIIEYCSKMQPFSCTMPFEKKVMPTKSDTRDDKTLEPKMEGTTPHIQKDSPKIESELETQLSAKTNQLIKELSLTKEQTSDSNAEDDNKTYNSQSSDYELSNQNGKAKENMPSNYNIGLNNMPTVALESPKNKNATLEAIQNLKDIISKIPIDMNQNETDNQKPGQPTNAKANAEPLLITPFEMRRISLNSPDGIDVFIVDNSNVSRGIIGAFECAHARNFSDLHSRLSQFKDSQPYKPVLREYVIAKFKDAWYRAKVMEIKTNQLTLTYDVMYVEFTNVSTVTGEDIRRYPPDLTTPCYTSICLIEGFPHRPTKAQINFLQEKVQMHSVLHIDAVNYLQDMALVRCNALIDALNKIP